MVSKTAERIADKTSDAFSAARYNSWPAVADALLKEGYTEDETEMLMRSTWARHAEDNHYHQDGKVPARVLVEFVKKQGPEARKALYAGYVKTGQAPEGYSSTSSQFKFNPGKSDFYKGWEATINDHEARITEDDPDEWWLTVDDKKGRVIYNGVLHSKQEAEEMANTVAKEDIESFVTRRLSEMGVLSEDNPALTERMTPEDVRDELRNERTWTEEELDDVESAIDNQMSHGTCEWPDCVEMASNLYGPDDDLLCHGHYAEAMEVQNETGKTAVVLEKKKSSKKGGGKGSKKKSHSKTSGWTKLKEELPNSGDVKSRIRSGGHTEAYTKVLKSLQKYWEKRGK